MSEDGLEDEWAPPPEYEIEIGTEPLERPARNSVGGWPCFDDGQEWPRCFCGERMALFFPLDLPDDIEFFGGEHLSVFHCAHHHDAADPVTAGDRADRRLVPRFWEAPQPPFPGSFWRVLLQRDPGAPEAEPEPTVRALPLSLRPFVDGHGPFEVHFKVGVRRPGLTKPSTTCARAIRSWRSSARCRVTGSSASTRVSGAARQHP
ncbi:hypothetical protein ACR6C2_29165 [Streptomyces sp. INA 01156]